MGKTRTASSSVKSLTDARAADAKVKKAKKNLERLDEEERDFQKRLKIAMAEKVRETMATVPTLSPVAKLSIAHTTKRQMEYDRDLAIIKQHDNAKNK